MSTDNDDIKFTDNANAAALQISANSSAASLDATAGDPSDQNNSRDSVLSLSSDSTPFGITPDTLVAVSNTASLLDPHSEINAAAGSSSGVLLSSSNNSTANTYNVISFQPSRKVIDRRKQNNDTRDRRYSSPVVVDQFDVHINALTSSDISYISNQKIISQFFLDKDQNGQKLLSYKIDTQLSNGLYYLHIKAQIRSVDNDLYQTQNTCETTINTELSDAIHNALESQPVIGLNLNDDTNQQSASWQLLSWNTFANVCMGIVFLAIPALLITAWAFQHGQIAALPVVGAFFAQVGGHVVFALSLFLATCYTAYQAYHFLNTSGDDTPRHTSQVATSASTESMDPLAQERVILDRLTRPNHAQLNMQTASAAVLSNNCHWLLSPRNMGAQNNRSINDNGNSSGEEKDNGYTSN